MVELPEAMLLSQQMNKELAGKTIKKAFIDNFKPTIFFLNVSVNEFIESVTNCTIESVFCRGKWIYLELNSGQFFATAPEMGANILFHEEDSEKSDNYHFKFVFTDGTSLTLKYLGFIFARLGTNEELEAEKYPGKIGPTPLDKEFSFDHFSNLVTNSNKMIKAILLDHQNLPGVSNFYLNEALFRAKIHPKRKANSLSTEEQKLLVKSLKDTLQDAYNARGRKERKDIYGVKGSYLRSLHSKSVGLPCPNCKSTVVKINVAGTNNYVCENCQKLE
jgi:formamidopyrimidine-DNA glycosylase